MATGEVYIKQVMPQRVLHSSYRITWFVQKCRDIKPIPHSV